VNVWLNHWLSRQVKEWRPLVLLDTSRAAKNKKSLRPVWTGKKKKPEWVNLDVNDDTDNEQEILSDKLLPVARPSATGVDGLNGFIGPPGPAGFAKSLETW
jgi:hypothetical protein